MTPLYSWIAVLVTVGGLTWYYAGRPNILAKFLPQKDRNNEGTSVEKSRRKKQRGKRNLAGEQIGSESATSTSTVSNPGSSKKRKLVDASKDDIVWGQGKSVAKPPSADEEDGNLSNQAFAKQLAQARNGTILRPENQNSKSKTERRAHRAVQSGIESPNLSAEASSTTGVDADDDMSSAGSPRLGPSRASAVAKAGDVSDMLEAPAAKARVLRLTDPKGHMNQSKPKPAAKAPEVVETKKQRQARQKREAQKALNEQAEKERKQQMEKQIRIARMTEGTSTQTKANSFQPPTENAWLSNKGGEKEESVKSAKGNNVALLDTFDAAAEPEHKATVNGSVQTASFSDIANEHTMERSVELLKKVMGIGQTEALGATTREMGNEPGSSNQSNTSWADDLPSEEEQMRMIQEEDAWTTVPSKKDKKKSAVKTQELDATSEASADARRVNSTQKPKQNQPTTRPVLHKQESSTRFQFNDMHDDEWAA